MLDICVVPDKISFIAGADALQEVVVTVSGYTTDETPGPSAAIFRLSSSTPTRYSVHPRQGAFELQSKNGTHNVAGAQRVTIAVHAPAAISDPVNDVFKLEVALAIGDAARELLCEPDKCDYKSMLRSAEHSRTIKVPSRIAPNDEDSSLDEEVARLHKRQLQLEEECAGVEEQCKQLEVQFSESTAALAILADSEEYAPRIPLWLIVSLAVLVFSVVFAWRRGTTS